MIAALRAGIPSFALAALLLLCACAKAPSADPQVVSAGKAFLAGNAHAPGIHVTPSGLQYRVLQSGPADGPSPRITDEVKVNYEGRLLDGSVFDSTYDRGAPAVMAVSGLIPAWTEALQLMRPGDVWELYVPPELGYGDNAVKGIPAGSVLQFKIELIALNVENAGGVP
jgi:peptidylprolyl isomerase/FKBP-type peptidyl-prolyl cis-trans isomerase FklB